MITEQEQAFNAWWAGLPEDERVAVFHKTQMRMAFNAAWKARQEKDEWIALSERVANVGPDDEAYNNACDHIAQAIREQQL